MSENNSTIKTTDKNLIFLWTSPISPHHIHTTCKLLTNLLIQPYDYLYSLQFKSVNSMDLNLVLLYTMNIYHMILCKYLICFKAILKHHFDKFCWFWDRGYSKSQNSVNFFTCNEWYYFHPNQLKSVLDRSYHHYPFLSSCQ